MTLELTNLGGEAPSGENLEYDPAFTALEIAAQPGEERQRGNEIVAAEEPDYVDIIRKAGAVLERSHDIRAAVYLAHAELRRNGLTGFAGPVAYIRGCLSDYWDSCHPQLDADDDNDPTMRVNAVRGLTDSETILSALRSTPMTQSHSFGRITMRDLMVLDGELPAEEDADTPDAASASAAFKDTDPEILAGMFEAARQAADDINAIDAVFDEKIPGYGPDLGDLKKTIGRIVSRFAQEIGVPEEADPLSDDGASDDGQPAQPVQAGVGTISSSRDVLTALDRIIEFYARTEPSSPVPIFLNRAKRLVGADFMTIVNDLAPMALENVTHIGGATGEDN